MRILIFGDLPGVPQLLRHISTSHLVGIVCAVIRPQYHAALSEVAQSHQLPLLIQPKVNSPDYAAFKESVNQLAPDLILVNSYSMILREEILAIPRLGGINIHGALLPQYRGCNPTQWAILNGESLTGVTMHEMSAGLDEGRIIDQRAVPMFFEDTWQSAYARISRATDDLIATNLDAMLSGNWQARSQDDAEAKYYRRRSPDDGLFDWSQPVIAIYNKIRALLPPLPPAFYLDASGTRVPMLEQLTPWQLAALKYGRVGGGSMLAKRVRLRALRREDSALLYEWINQRELVIFNAPYHPVSEVDHESWLESMMKKRFDLVIFVIEDIASGQALGSCQLFNINWRHRSAELQIRLGDQRFQNQGLGSEAVQLLCRFGFADLNMHRIYLNVFKNNERAIGAYRKCGFVEEGVMREAAFIDGQWLDVTLMALLNDQR
jgi:methionyl-tRNA formyltransferase/RimJ/RimL family protein N-acetyltransferase